MVSYSRIWVIFIWFTLWNLITLLVDRQSTCWGSSRWIHINAWTPTFSQVIRLIIAFFRELFSFISRDANTHIVWNGSWLQNMEMNCGLDALASRGVPVPKQQKEQALRNHRNLKPVLLWRNSPLILEVASMSFLLLKFQRPILGINFSPIPVSNSGVVELRANRYATCLNHRISIIVVVLQRIAQDTHFFLWLLFLLLNKRRECTWCLCIYLCR